jgi:hypothetical protein
VARTVAGLPPVPATVRATVTARLDALSPAERAATRDAAALGAPVTAAGLAAVSGRTEEEAAGLLRRLERQDVLRQRRATAAPGGPEYRFRHPLVRDVAYDQLPRDARLARHRRAAAWLAGLPPEWSGLAEPHRQRIAELTAPARPAGAGPVGQTRRDLTDPAGAWRATATTWDRVLRRHDPAHPRLRATADADCG